MAMLQTSGRPTACSFGSSRATAPRIARASRVAPDARPLPPPAAILPPAASTSSCNDAPAYSLGRREALASVLALAGSLSLARVAAAASAAPADAAEQAVDEYAQLEASGKFKNVKVLDDFRSKHRFKRMPDGRVFLRSSKGEYYAVRLDMEVPGAMLFRDPNGYVYALQTEALQQIDLSNDQVVILMFSEGDWESSMSPIEYSDESGNVKTLKMSESDFRNVVGLINLMDKKEEDEAK